MKMLKGAKKEFPILSSYKLATEGTEITEVLKLKRYCAKTKAWGILLRISLVFRFFIFSRYLSVFSVTSVAKRF